MKEDPKKMVKKVWTCTGKARLESGGMGVFFLDADGKSRGFKPKGRRKRFYAGLMYELDVAEDGSSAVLSSARYAAHSKDPRRAEWEAEEAAEEGAATLEKREADAASRSALNALLQPVIAAGKKTNHAGRAAIKLHVLYLLDQGWRMW